MSMSQIKGITVEIGGDTTKLGKALEDVNKRSSSLSKELGEINKMLKFDPGNTELLAQKQKVLTEAIGDTKSKLETLREAEKQVQEQFERGEVSEQQYRALQREVVATEQKLGSYEDALEDTEKAMNGLDEETQDVEEHSGKLGSVLGTVGKGLLSVASAAGAGAVALGKSVIESYADYEQLVGGVETLFETSAKSIAGRVQRVAENAYKGLDTATLDRLGEQVVANAQTFSSWENDVGTSLDAISDALRYGVGSAAEDTAGYLEHMQSQYRDFTAEDAAKMYNAVSVAIRDNSDALGDYMAQLEDIPDATEMIMSNAAEAYKTAGMSANDYMETVTSVSASLIQSLNGDTVAAAEYAQKAIVDMSDNANKMGTDISSIVSAYQGFAKQNYTMLDNLKLGYGGTQQEMFRLMTTAAELDAEFAATAEFSMDGKNHLTAGYADIVQAIHIVQTEMGITGTTALEAEATISGSIGMLKASFENLITGLGTDGANVQELMQHVADSFSTVVGNVTPVVERLIDALPVAFDAVLRAVADLLPGILELLVDLTDQVIDLIVTTLPTVLSAAVDAVLEIADALLAKLPDLADAVIQILQQLGDAVLEALPDLLRTLVDALPDLLQAYLDFNFLVVDLIVELINVLVGALPEIIAALVDMIPPMIDAIVETMISRIDVLVEGFVELFTALLVALPEILQMIEQAMPRIIDAVIRGLISLGSKIYNSIYKPIFEAFCGWVKEIVAKAGELGRDFVAKIVEFFSRIPTQIAEFLSGALQAVTSWAKTMPQKAKEAAKNAFDAIVNTLRELPSRVLDIGKNIVTGLWNGITSMVSWITEKVKSFAGTVLDGIKNALGIHSPSKEMAWVGKMMAEGLAAGLTDSADDPIRAMEQLSQRVLGATDIDGVALDRQFSVSSAPIAVTATTDSSLMSKLDRILSAIEAGSIITLDGSALIGATAGKMDQALGQRHLLAARGAI